MNDLIKLQDRAQKIGPSFAILATGLGLGITVIALMQAQSESVNEATTYTQLSAFEVAGISMRNHFSEKETNPKAQCYEVAGESLTSYYKISADLVEAQRAAALDGEAFTSQTDLLISLQQLAQMNQQFWDCTQYLSEPGVFP